MGTDQAYRIVPLDEISPNPWNPRQVFVGKEFDELVGSVAAKGVLAPIMLRPVEGKAPFQIVAGERRWRAMCKVAEQNGGRESGSIPAVIRDLTDDEAFEITMIENLQRQDLTELEEAESFGKYLDRKGMEALPELAERTGIHPRYIRRRVAVLALPKKALNAWNKGDLKYGHLEQFTRLKNKKEIDQYVQMIIRFNGGMTVRELRKRIDDTSPQLGWAKFDTEKAGCLQCRQNSDVQKNLFGEFAEMNKTRCLDPACFKQRQNNHINKNWKKSGYYKKHHTTGFRFRMDLNWDDYSCFYHNPGRDKCRSCANFVTLIDLDGTVDEGKVCIGDKGCFNKVTATGPKNTPKKKQDTGGPRVAWHGEHFREEFYNEQLPMRFEKLPADDPRVVQFALISLLDSNRDLRTWFSLRHGLGDARKIAEEAPERLEWWCVEIKAAAEVVFRMDFDQVLVELKEASLQVILMGPFGPDGRRQVGDYLDIDLKAEWRITKEYLDKKVIKEILAMGEEFGVFENPKAQAFLYEALGKKRKAFKNCKKSELIRVFLESGVDLAGKVPAEILAEG